jgi:hypothetical protein
MSAQSGGPLVRVETGRERSGAAGAVDLLGEELDQLRPALGHTAAIRASDIARMKNAMPAGHAVRLASSVGRISGIEERECAWIAELDGRRVGCVLCVAGPETGLT